MKFDGEALLGMLLLLMLMTILIVSVLAIDEESIAPSFSHSMP